MAETPNPFRHADALLSIDQHRATVIDRIVTQWGDQLATSSAALKPDQLRTMLNGLRADDLLAASLAGTLDGLRNVLATAVAPPLPRDAVIATKALGDTSDDVVYTPVTPCRLVETRPGTFAAVYQGGGAFAASEIRNYTIQGGNGVCLTQLPAGLNPSAVQLQVFGIPVGGASGDIEILPQGSTFGSTATEVFLGTELITSASTTSRINMANNQIGVQVRGGGANVAIDVVGYFKAPSGGYFAQGGNSFGMSGKLGTLDNQPLELYANNQRAMRYEPNANSPNIVGGHPSNSLELFTYGATIAGGGAQGSGCFEPSTGLFNRSCANFSAGTYNTVGGGISNSAGGARSVVAGGESNTTAGTYATVAGGYANLASGFASTVSGGQRNTAYGTNATIPGGLRNTASGSGSFAAGHDSTADQIYCVVFGLWSSGFNSSCLGTASIFKVMGDNGFSVDYHLPVGGGGDRWLAIGPFSQFGIPATIVTWNHAYLSDAGVWVNASSSRATKTDFQPVDVDVVLHKVAQMPITTWRYREGEGDVHHMGPMSEDFYAAFTVGYGPQTIADLDARGVAFAAIQGLNAKVEERSAALQLEIAAKDAKIDAQARELEDLRNRLAHIEAVLTSKLHATH